MREPPDGVNARAALESCNVRRLGPAFGFYALASVALFGRDVARSPDLKIVGDDGSDKTLYLWSLEWWPTALRHAHNPLDVDVAWAPHGFDFGLGTAGGGLALAAAPLTGLVGPVPTYNVLILLAPALAATTAFLLAQRLTGALGPALVGGWIYGFSSYELGRMLGHLPLAFVALVPLVAYLVVRRHAGELSSRAFVGWLAALLLFQFLIVTQIYFTVVVLGACAAALAALVLGWQAVRDLVRDGSLAFIVSLVVVSPVVAYAFLSDATAPVRSPFAESADVLNYFVPTRRTWIRPPGSAEVAERFTATGAEQGAYLSLPLLLLAALAFARRPISRSRLLLGALFLTAVVLSLGTRPKLAGEVFAVGPWAVVAPLPVLGSALPARFTLFAALFAGMLVALALADRGGRLRWALAVAGIVLTLPNLGLPQWSSQVPRPRFFELARDQKYVPEGTTALVLPYGPAGWSMLWQAEAAFRFSLVGGHFALRVTPAEREWSDVYKTLNFGRVTAQRLRSFLMSHCVDVVVVTPGTRGSARRAVEAAVGEPPARAADSLVYDLRPDEARSGRAAASGQACESSR